MTVSADYLDALQFAAELHNSRGESHAATRALSVSAQVLESGGTEAIAIAAVLYQLVEQSALDIRVVGDRFGEDVAEIIVANRFFGPASLMQQELFPTTSEPSSLEAQWQSKAKRYRSNISGSPDVALRLALAITTADLQQLNGELRDDGTEAWIRQPVGANELSSHFRLLGKVFRERLGDGVTQNYQSLESRLRRLAMLERRRLKDIQTAILTKNELRERWPNNQSVFGTVGGEVFIADDADGFYVITDESGMAEFTKEDLDLRPRARSFPTKRERSYYLWFRGWGSHPDAASPPNGEVA